MKRQLSLSMLLLIFGGFSGIANEGQKIFDVHNRWISAFEQTDIKAVDALWRKTPNATLVTIFGDPLKGWKKVRKTIQTSFALTHKTTITGSDLVVTVSGEAASATMDYRWSFLPNTPLKATELFSKEKGVWKMYTQDGTGQLAPLRPLDEKRIRQLVHLAQATMEAKAIDALKALTADRGIIHVDFNGTVHREFDPDRIRKDLDKILTFRLSVIYLTDETATAHFTVTLIENNERNIRLGFLNFQLTRIDFAPKPLVVSPKAMRTMTWARIKAQMPD